MGVTRFRWVICALLFFATTILYVDRQILSLLKPILDDQMGWTATQFGAINAGFQAAYGVSLLFFGWLIDRWGTKRGYALSIGAWSIAAVGHALVGGIGSFAVARVALGLGEGGNFPGAIKAVAQWFPRAERALATSLFNSGANVGATLAPAIIPPIALSLGWHGAYVLVGLTGVVWLFLWWRFFDDPTRSDRVSEAELAHIESDPGDPGDAGAAMTWREVLRHREAWSFIAGKFLTDPIWWFFLIWLPDFFKKTRGLDIKGSWALLVGVYGIVTVLSLFGGWVTGWLVKLGWTVTRARKTGMALFALCVVPIAFATRVGDWTAVILIGLAGAAHQAWSANLYSTVSDMFPKRAVAAIVGLGGMAGSIGAMIFPIVSGVILDRFTEGYAILFGFCSGAYILAFVVNHLLAPRFERVRLD
ncbi:MFS transporter, ACS family, hexuronate transporter [Verrucomicrobium sp. GAS474]|uniref:MFS transporter n=1 Tax=Verrucomicrobium sp. GAS474 TaxID=1882831 RepID=UPI00087BF50E|nr:MFS transporter [Verrucomicrobium sp. GAS474]SDU27727.1 MFS transporter, ACS family, hexuronate transporter [Verrucomicrobium sp. GAS474]